jgi:hypothetical protein
MNENDQANVPNLPNVPQVPSSPPPPPPVTPSPDFVVSSKLPEPTVGLLHRPLSWWLRKFFACNPFYLVSAALLLYGCYRVSIDETFMDSRGRGLRAPCAPQA